MVIRAEAHKVVADTPAVVPVQVEVMEVTLAVVPEETMEVMEIMAAVTQVVARLDRKEAEFFLEDRTEVGAVQDLRMVEVVVKKDTPAVDPVALGDPGTDNKTTTAAL